MSVFQAVVAEVSPTLVQRLQEKYASTLQCGAPNSNMTDVLRHQIQASFPAVEVLVEEDGHTMYGLRMLGMWEELSNIQFVLGSWVDAPIENLSFSVPPAQHASCQTEMDLCNVLADESPDHTAISVDQAVIPDADSPMKSPHAETLECVTSTGTQRRRSKKLETPVALPSRKSSRVPRKKNLDDYHTPGRPTRDVNPSTAVSEPRPRPSRRTLPVAKDALETPLVTATKSEIQDIEVLFAATVDEEDETIDDGSSDAIETSVDYVVNNHDSHGTSESTADSFPLFEDVAKYERLSEDHYVKVEKADTNDDEGEKPNVTSVEYTCKYCNFKASVHRNLKCHIYRNHLEKKHVCVQCDKAFGLKKDLKRHLLQHTGKYACSENDCDLSFDKKVALRKHLKKVHNILRTQGKERVELSCSKCSFTSTSGRSLISHVTRMHGEKSHACPICPKGFALLKDLRQHLRSHSESFCCEICGKQLRSKYGLQKHVDIIHNKQERRPGKSYLCTTCGALCRSKTQYKIHMNREHLNIKPFKCKYCDMTFFAKANLTVHLHVHSEERKCVCNHCGKSFKQAQSLRIHKISHADVRPFKCDICSKSFTQKGALVRHQRIHTGEKPYACKLCSSSFNDYSILRRHVLAIHKIDDHHLVRRSIDDSKTREIIESLAIAASEGEAASILEGPEKGSAGKLKSKARTAIQTEHVKADIDMSTVHVVKTESDVSAIGAMLDQQVSAGLGHHNITIHSNEAQMTEIRVLPEHYDRMSSIILQAAQQSFIASSLPEVASAPMPVSAMDSQLEVQAVEVLSHLHQPTPGPHQPANVIHIPQTSLLQQALAMPIIHEAGIPILSVQEQLHNVQEVELIVTPQRSTH